MNICIPTTQDNGLDSRVSAHFGSAPFFAIVDAESRVCRSVPNANHSHEHGRCQPLAALAGQAIDSVVVGGIGAGALSKLTAAGIRVYMASAGSVKEAVEAYNSGTLAEISPAGACQGHDHGQSGHGAHHHCGSGQNRFEQSPQSPGADSPRRGGRSGER
jgi:predicted Fe-Mo cluster-binding NifX family protein